MKKTNLLPFVRISLFLIIVGIFAPACQPSQELSAQGTGAASTPTVTPVVVAASGSNEAGQNLGEEPVPDTAAPELSPTESASPAEIAQGENATGASNADVLRLTFPTPGPEPVSNWRPPLYEAPWALGPNDHFYFTRPIAADVVNWPLKDYRYGGIFFGDDIIHTGIDIPNRKGTPVLAAGPGKVVWAGYGLFTGANSPDDPYGLAVTIKHDFGYQGHQLYTIYAHMDRIDVIYGQRVETGDKLGAVGDTGNTTGPHLHFEVRLDYNSFYSTRNPELWLAPPQGWGVLVGRLTNTNTSMLNRVDVEVESLETGRKWTVTTYGKDTVHSDDYYRENLVLSDLPAGEYIVSLDYQDEPMETQVTIRPGAVTYFSFRGKYGFTLGLPAAGAPEEVLNPYP